MGHSTVGIDQSAIDSARNTAGASQQDVAADDGGAPFHAATDRTAPVKRHARPGS
jgi:hypothetical protein